MPLRLRRSVDTDSVAGPIGFPLWASLVPALGAVGLWVLTGSPLSLWFAALGPLLAVAGALDRRHARRRERRRAERLSAREAADREHEEAGRRRAETQRQWSRTPDLSRLLDEPAEIWRDDSTREPFVVLGAHADDGSPVVVEAAGSIQLRGTRPLVAAAARALIVELCLRYAPGRLQLVGDGPPGWTWLNGLPHRSQVAALRVAVVEGERWRGPLHGDVQADVVIILGTGPFAASRLRLELGSGECILDVEGERTPVYPPFLSAHQAVAVARSLARRGGEADAAASASLASLIDSADAAAGTLAAVWATAEGLPCKVDLVADGPHALVTGTTGSGKSELLRSWVTAIAAQYPPTQVTLLLADFKGGMSFEGLRDLPHVCGVLTDLDDGAARRALESLRAEVRRRERMLADAGAHDIAAHPAGRLVIVVDEFAALADAHPSLISLFTDLAARGRALGIHLILGTQRASGVFREALLANCALRVALRAADGADSRLMIGDDRAAQLPGGVGGAGLAYLRRAADATASRIRVACADRDLIAEVAARWSQIVAPPPPWLPPLPTMIALPDPAESASRGDVQTLWVGVVDEPALQRQRPIGIPSAARGLVVVGRAGAGVTTALRTLAAQCERATWIHPGDLEQAWDVLTSHSTARTLVVDRADELLARMPPEYASEAAHWLELAVRASGGAGGAVLLGAERWGGALSRIADLIPHRLLLAHTHAVDLLAHGGRPENWSPHDPPGRGTLDGMPVQVYLPPADARPHGVTDVAPRRQVPRWTPTAPLTLWVTRATPGAAEVMARWAGEGIEILPVSAIEAAPAPEGDSACVVRGDPEQWQRSWTRIVALREHAPLLIDPSCAAEFRMLTGTRSLPPLCVGPDRAWYLEPAAEVQRVRL